MTLVHSALAPGLLIVSGFIGGFCVTNGSGKYLGLLPAHHAVSRAPHANEDAAAGIMAAADGQTSQGGRRRHGAGGSGGQGGGGGGAGDGSTAAGAEQGGADQGGASGDGAQGAAAMNGSGGTMTRAADAAARAGTPRLVSGVEAGAILAGNTVVADAARQRYIYFAPRGLRIEGNRNGFTARLWDRDKATLCGPGSDGVLVCRIVEVRASGTRSQATGTPVGEVRMDGDHWLPILSGNIQSFPDHVPVLDSVVAAPRPDRTVFKATATGKAAWAALLDHPAAVAPAAPGQAGRIVTFAKDGSVLDIERPQDEVDATSLNGTMGTWTFAKGLLCRKGAEPDAVSACFTIEARGKTSFRLIAKGTGEAMRLELLTESAPRQRQAAQ